MLGSDVVYSEGAVIDLMATLVELCGTQTTIILAGELRNGKNFSFNTRRLSDVWNMGANMIVSMQMPSSNTS